MVQKHGAEAWSRLKEQEEDRSKHKHGDSRSVEQAEAWTG
jgi:hypothetical protein